MVDFAKARDRMVEGQLSARGIDDPRVLVAFRTVPREAFVSLGEREHAYADRPLPIGEGQTISQPYIVALTAQSLHLDGSESLLEVGTGSGYAAAIFGKLARLVFTVERHPFLVATARESLAAAGCTNVFVALRDGSLGWPEQAPFDAIAVAASGPDVPPALLQQLGDGGRLVMPVGRSRPQVLTRVLRQAEGRFREESLTEVHFVPLIGAQAWREGAPATSGPWAPSSIVEASTGFRPESL